MIDNKKVEAAYKQPMSDRYLAIAVLAGLLLFLCGIWFSKALSAWWPV